MAGLKRYAAYLVLFSSYLLLSCSVQQQLSRSAKETVLQQPAFKAAHAGISIYEPATGKYWFNYQGDKYFVPASNTKIPTCYAAMKYLGDSLVGLRYDFINNNILIIQGTADPSFLHSDFKVQPAFNFLNNLKGVQIVMANPKWEDDGLGSGWSWNDYAETYMAERSSMPLYGNVARFKYNKRGFVSIPKYFRVDNEVYDSHVLTILDTIDDKYTIQREKSANNFSLRRTKQPVNNIDIPFIPSISVISGLLKDTLSKAIASDFDFHLDKPSRVIHSQPTDSLLKPMMHRSDNFFAEQSLLMVSNELLGVMNDEKIIDTLLKTDFKDLPQKPRWADGSGLSRYNLFTPQDMVAILNKMKKEFGMERIKVIFPTGGEGTISSYYKQDAGFIYGKTGTLSGVVAFSGFLYTKKGKLLIFSTLINNHLGSATDIRRAIENFLQGVRSKY